MHEEHFNDERALMFWCPLRQVGPGDAGPEYVTSPGPYGLLLPHQRAGDEFRIAHNGGLEFAPVAVPLGACVVHHSYAVYREAAHITDVRLQAFAFRFRGSSYRESLRRADGR